MCKKKDRELKGRLYLLKCGVEKRNDEAVKEAAGKESRRRVEKVVDRREGIKGSSWPREGRWESVGIGGMGRLRTSARCAAVARGDLSIRGVPSKGLPWVTLAVLVLLPPENTLVDDSVHLFVYILVEDSRLRTGLLSVCFDL